MCAEVRISRVGKDYLRSIGFPAPVPETVGELRKTWPRAFPGMPLPAVVRGPDGPSLDSLAWGLIPSWAPDRKFGRRCFNARAETVAEKPAFRSAFRRRRCVVLVDAWFEWGVVDGKKVKHAFGVASAPIVTLAGLWESWTSPEGEVVRSCTVVTTAANDVARPIHDRMPAVLDRDGGDVWLDPGAPTSLLHGMLVPFPGALTVERVAK